MSAIFIIGTDTGVGKTHVALTLIQQLNNSGYTTFGIKPFASGGEMNSDGLLENDDALRLQACASVKRPYPLVNPLVFKEYIAPHLAAQNEGVQLCVESVLCALKESMQVEADFKIIEGAGGWSVPLNDRELLSDLVKALKIPTILVVGIKLGCLNHAILTQQSILEAQVPLIGWIANRVEPDTLAADDNIETLKRWLNTPLLGIVPYGLEHQPAKHYINLDQILPNSFNTSPSFSHGNA